MLGHLLVYLLVRSHRSLIPWLCTASLRACSAVLICSPTHSLPIMWENQDVLNHSAFGSSSALEIVVVVVGKSFMVIVDEILGPVDIFVPKLLQPFRKPTS